MLYDNCLNQKREEKKRMHTKKYEIEVVRQQRNRYRDTFKKTDIKQSYREQKVKQLPQKLQLWGKRATYRGF